nr:unnamed protein product [Digitaria exilis]
MHTTPDTPCVSCWLSRLPSLGGNAPPRLLGSTKPNKLPSSSSRPSLLPVVRRRRVVRLRRRRRLGSTEQQQAQIDEVVDSNILPYCSIDKKQKKTLGEMEQEFLQALQACPLLF